MGKEISNSYRLCKGESVNAIYSEQALKEYKGNPSIEALPPIYSKAEVIRRLSKIPDYNEEERNLEEHYRFHCIQKLFDFFEPLQKHIDIEQRFSRVIRQGYISRNPIGTEYATSLHEGYKRIKAGEYDYVSSIRKSAKASGFTIIGISGIGKTTTIERILSLYPQVIHHTEYKGENLNLYQIPWLKLDCPFDGSLKGLCINFFQAVDELLGTDYLRKFGVGRNSVDTMLPRMEQIANLHSIGVLIIDEIQHLSLAKSGGSSKMLNFFVTLVNTIGIPVILIGTTAALPILQGEFRQARRGSGQGDLLWHRMKNDGYWRLLMQGMWPLQWTKKENPLTEEIINTIYDESQGIIDIAVKLYAMAQIKAIVSGKELITPKIVRHTAKESLQLVQPMLEALRSGDKIEISKYQDITPIDFSQIYTESIAKASTHSSNKMVDEIEIIEEYAVLKLVELGIDANIAKLSVREAITTNPRNLDKIFLVKAAMKIAFEKEQDKLKENVKEKAKKGKRKLQENDLRYIVDMGKKNLYSAYEALNKAGYIKDPVAEFINKENGNVELFSKFIS
ncbi:ATP-binding protein [Clostridium saccharoperbutylacetonicum]|uniref:ATP-binding protein n=1 Tax=Clostridium saccharoperbutylacetonicum TaxID=36745 RepID=UPI0039ED1960